MKRIALFALSLLIVLSISCKANSNDKNVKETEEQITLNSDEIASVNGEAILKADYNKNVALVRYSYEQRYGKDYFSKKENESLLNELKKDLISEMVNSKLIVEYAQKNSIKVDEKVLETDFNAAKKRIKNDEILKKLLEDNKIDDEFIKKSIEEQHLSNLIIKKITEDLKKDEKRIRKMEKDHILRVKASHILVKDEKEAKEIYENLKKDPSKFEEIAKKKSIDPGSAKNGGDLGFFSRGRMIAEFEEVAFSGKVGQIQEPVKTNYGYHIIKTTKKETIDALKKAGAKAGELKDMMEKVIYEESINEFNKEIDKLKKEAKIKINKEK